MPNVHVATRLKGIQSMLQAVYQASAGMSAASKGAERAAFIDDFLAGVLPPHYRFGSGDATDIAGRRTGQLDVVVEYPFAPSLPIVGSGTTRLYLAESIAAVIEVKSDVSAQWSEALETASKLSTLERKLHVALTMGPAPLPRIPLFVASYRGWKSLETVSDKLKEGSIDGILIIDPGVFVSTEQFGGIRSTGEWALWGLIQCLHTATASLQAATSVPLSYAIDDF